MKIYGEHTVFFLEKTVFYGIDRHWSQVCIADIQNWEVDVIVRLKCWVSVHKCFLGRNHKFGINSLANKIDDWVMYKAYNRTVKELYGARICWMEQDSNEKMESIIRRRF